MKNWTWCAIALAIATLMFSGGCGRGNSIKITGSDTMVNLAQAWRERYQDVEPGVSLQVKGGGTGVGLAALCQGRVDIATASRPISDEEIELAKKKTGKAPKEFLVGLDALAIFVHLENPIDSITIPQLAEIYGAGGTITKWSDLSVKNDGCADGEIIRVSRQNSSGTYVYFREAVLGKDREYAQGITSLSGSSDIVALISKTPCAIGYSGMGYRSDNVKMLKVAKQDGQPGVEPTRETATDGTYPISRPLLIYTLGEPTGHVKDLVDWMLSDDGQKIVEASGYVRAPKNNAK
jgi:phosphate transport system substrate-binding protein